MVRIARITFGTLALGLLLVLSGCPSPFLDAIKKAVANAPFTGSAYKFVRQWGNPYPQYSFGSAVVKVDTAGYVYVADSTFRIRKFDSSGNLQKTYDVASTTGISGTVYDMAFDSSGNMYVATSGTNRILKYDVSGNLLLQWGTSATINTAAAITVDSSGAVYVLDSGNNAVFKFDSYGNPGTPASWTGTGTNSIGSAFSGPRGIAVDVNGYLYVADTGHNVVKVYIAASGNYNSLWTLAFSSPEGIAVDSSYSPTFYIADSGNNRIVKTTNGSSIAASWGTPGTANGQFTSLADVAIDASANVYAADLPSSSGLGNGLGRVQKFTNTGSFLASWGGVGYSGNGQFNEPAGIALDSSGNVYVSDLNNSRVEKFDSTGNYLGQWGSAATYGPFWGALAADSAGNVYVPDNTNKVVKVLNSSMVQINTIGNGTLSSPTAVALDSAGNIYVTDAGLGKVVVFDSKGYTTHIPATIGSSGTADGQFVFPVGVVVDSVGNVYVADLPILATRTHMIQKFDANGNFVKAWGTQGTGDGQVYLPMGIAVDKADNIYVCDFVNRRIEKFDSNGTYLGKWGGVGVGNGTFGWPFGVAVDGSGNVIVSDVTNNLIQEFAPSF